MIDADRVSPRFRVASPSRPHVEAAHDGDSDSRLGGERELHLDVGTAIDDRLCDNDQPFLLCAGERKIQRSGRIPAGDCEEASSGHRPGVPWANAADVIDGDVEDIARGRVIKWRELPLRADVHVGEALVTLAAPPLVTLAWPWMVSECCIPICVP